MDKFVKVKWLEPPHSIEYGTIPSNWIEERNDSFWVCWPPVPNVKPLILNRQLPKKDWFRFILLKKYGSGSSFSECELVPSAIDTNEDTDDDNLSKRKCRTVLPYFMSDSDDLDNDIVSNQPKRPKLVCSSDEEQETIINKFPLLPPSLQKLPSNLNLITKKRQRIDLEIDPESQTKVPSSQSYLLQHNTSCSSKTLDDIDSTPSVSQDVFQKNVMKILKNLKKDLSDIKQTQKDLIEKFSVLQHTGVDNVNTFVLIIIDNVEDLGKLESKLEDKSIYLQLVAVLARACGIHPKKSIYEAMNKLLTKDVASKYNITGTAKKCNFCTEFKNIYSAIIEAVSSQHADTKDIQLHSFIGEWLRQAGVLNIRTEKKKIENPNKTL
ncbi:uncharacterized protein LOC136078354 [Hydra vulgaris]|uniref:Uncharacterized protein LOC136078354 n=1 Tax=Hydra vulgaris TaxID=6087 RepID=A0ABM4BM23_HYDVU